MPRFCGMGGIPQISTPPVSTPAPSPASPPRTPSAATGKAHPAGSPESSSPRSSPPAAALRSSAASASAWAGASVSHGCPILVVRASERQGGIPQTPTRPSKNFRQLFCRELPPTMPPWKWSTRAQSARVLPTERLPPTPPYLFLFSTKCLQIISKPRPTAGLASADGLRSMEANQPKELGAPGPTCAKPKGPASWDQGNCKPLPAMPGLCLFHVDAEKITSFIARARRKAGPPFNRMEEVKSRG